MESLGLAPTLAGQGLSAGSKVGEYVVERFLGAGAMGEVYAARHPIIHKRVAIKILKLAATAEATERFVREARAVNAVAHANVVDVFGFGTLDDGRHYLAMDLVDGASLRARLATPIAVDEALAILDQVAAALDAAHGKGVVHRDLKPDNVMLASDGRVIVLDFGIAKLVDANANAPQLTGQGAWLGTPAYMAPEQWSADGAVAASDRYALGVMAFELLAGKLPFAAGTLPQMMEQHFRAPVPALSTRGATAERGVFDPVLRRALAKDPDARFATASELVAALRAARGSKVPRRWLAPVAGACVLGLGIAAVLATRGDATPTPAPPPAATKIEKPFVIPTATGFEGVWRLPDGRLRRFQRIGDRVDSFARDAVNGPDGAAHSYDFQPADDGVAFGATEPVQDERSADASCLIPHRVSYHYRSAPEQLTISMERVGVTVAGGACTVIDRANGAPIALRRVDTEPREVRYTPPPIGKPILPPRQDNAIPNDTMQNALDNRQAPEVIPNAPSSLPTQTQAPVQKL